MANLYNSEPDARQSDEDIKVSRFRPRYRKLTEIEKEIHDDIKSKAEELEMQFVRVKQGRYHSLAITSLEESVMWIIKELTS